MIRWDPPLPANRASGSPTHGSPVDGFLIEIGSPEQVGLRAWVKARAQ